MRNGEFRRWLERTLIKVDMIIHFCISNPPEMNIWRLLFWLVGSISALFFRLFSATSVILRSSIGNMFTHCYFVCESNSYHTLFFICRCWPVPFSHIPIPQPVYSFASLPIRIEYESMFWYHYTKDTVPFRMLTCRLIFISKCKNMPILTYSWTYSYSMPLSVLYFQLKWFNIAFSCVPVFTWYAFWPSFLLPSAPSLYTPLHASPSLSST